MGTRTTYFCDWCGAVSPNETSIPYDWKRIPNDRGETEHVCGECHGDLTNAINEVKAKRALLKRDR